MRKATLTGMGNFGQYAFFIIKKDDKILTWLENVLYKSLGLTEDLSYYQNESTDYKERKRQYKDLIEKVNTFHTSKDKSIITLFFGVNRVFMSISGKKAETQRLIDAVGKNSKWIKVKNRSKFR